jgi:hypothetical protein
MREISPEDFAENYKEQVTNDLKDVRANLAGVASEAAPGVKDDLNEQIGKLDNAISILCDVPPPCTDSSSS